MKCVALCALAFGLALLAVGCGSAGNRTAVHLDLVSPVAVSIDRSRASSRGPFVPAGAFFDRGEGSLSGLGAAAGLDMGDGMILSCVPGGRYAQVVDVRNRSNSRLTVTGATGRPIRAPQIFARVATQLRLEPLPHGMSFDGGVTYSRGWSSAPARPVAIPAGRRAIIQSNFRMARCSDLAGGRTLVIPGRLFLRYRSGGKTRVQTIDVPVSRIVLMQGAAEHNCGPRIVGGSSNIVAANMSCRVAQNAAVACKKQAAGSGTCESDGKVWDCLSGDSCWVFGNEAQWFTVSSRRGA